jgi:hypothetical protein
MLNREMTVLVNGEPLTFDVPVDCAIVLHGERVRLRMVQSRDRVRLAFSARDGLRVAHAIDVQPDQFS